MRKIFPGTALRGGWTKRCFREVRIEQVGSGKIGIWMERQRCLLLGKSYFFTMAAARWAQRKKSRANKIAALLMKTDRLIRPRGRTDFSRERRILLTGLVFSKDTRREGRWLLKGYPSALNPLSFDQTNIPAKRFPFPKNPLPALSQENRHPQTVPPE